MARKTVKVVDLVVRANDFLLHSPDDDTGARKGVCHFVETMLHDSGNYKGFNYLTARDMKNSFNGETPGIHEGESDDKKFEGTDRYRVYYYK